MRRQNTNSSFIVSFCRLERLTAADGTVGETRHVDVFVQQKKKTVTLNLLWTRTLPGSRSSVLCGKNTEGKTPYYSQTVAFRGCYYNDQHGITVGITVGFNIFNSIYIYIINDFSRTQNYFLSPFNLLEKSLSPNSAFKLYNTARVLCYMSCQPTIKSCHESLFFKSQTALKVAMSYG